MCFVSFASEQTDFTVSNEESLQDWFARVCISEGKALHQLTIVFCSDEHLLSINKEFLAHDYYTDVITFDYTEDSMVSGDIFISIDRVRENAQILEQTVADELERVMVHGLLHLLGYKDKSETEKALMTQKEDFYLSSRPA